MAISNATSIYTSLTDVTENVWCVIEAGACVVAGLIKEPAARRYYGRALDHYSHDLASRAG